MYMHTYIHPRVNAHGPPRHEIGHHLALAFDRHLAARSHFDASLPRFLHLFMYTSVFVYELYMCVYRLYMFVYRLYMFVYRLYTFVYRLYMFVYTHAYIHPRASYIHIYAYIYLCIHIYNALFNQFTFSRRILVGCSEPWTFDNHFFLTYF